MKKLAITLISIISLCSANISQGAETYKTLVCNAATPTATYNVPAGELWGVTTAPWLLMVMVLSVPDGRFVCQMEGLPGQMEGLAGVIGENGPKGALEG